MTTTAPDFTPHKPGQFCPDCIDDVAWMIAEQIREIVNRADDCDEGSTPYNICWQIEDGRGPDDCSEWSPMADGYAHFNTLHFRVHGGGDIARRSYLNRDRALNSHLFDCPNRDQVGQHWDYSCMDGGLDLDPCDCESILEVVVDMSDPATS